MKSERHRIAWVLLAALAAAGPALAARQARLIGKILDPDGKPIAGVTVTATSKEAPEYQEVVTTDGRGIFILDFERINVTYQYRFEKAGYVTTEANQTWQVGGTERHEFTMRAGEAPAGGAAQAPASTSNAAIGAFNAGVRALESKDYAAATAKFEEAVRHDPNLRPAWAALSRAHLEQKRWREAAEAAEKAIALGDTDESVLRARWEAYRQLGDAAKTQQAREELEKTGRLQEEAKRIHNEGVALSKRGDDQGAFAAFQQAVEIDPNFQQAWLALAVSGLKIGQAQQAEAAARKILEGDPQHAEALRIRYNAALQLQDEQKIVEALGGLAAIEPAMAGDNLFKLAVKAFDADDAARAKARFARVLELDPDHARANYYMGVILVREGANKEARARLQRFIELAPNDPDIDTAKGLLSYLGK